MNDYIAFKYRKELGDPRTAIEKISRSSVLTASHFKENGALLGSLWLVGWSGAEDCIVAIVTRDSPHVRERILKIVPFEFIPLTPTALYDLLSSKKYSLEVWWSSHKGYTDPEYESNVDAFFDFAVRQDSCYGCLSREISTRLLHRFWDKVLPSQSSSQSNRTRRDTGL